MPRLGDGTYQLPAGNPVTSGTTIQSDWANSTLADIANALTDSLSRTEGGFSAPQYFPSGSAGNPSISFTNAKTSGLYLVGSSDIRMSILGKDIYRCVDGAFQVKSGDTFRDVAISNDNYDVNTLLEELYAGGWNQRDNLTLAPSNDLNSIGRNGLYITTSDTKNLDTKNGSNVYGTVLHQERSGTGWTQIYHATGGNQISVRSKSNSTITPWRHLFVLDEDLTIANANTLIKNVKNGGVPINALVLDSATNLNSFRSPGFYYFKTTKPSGVGAPPTTTTGVLVVTKCSDTRTAHHYIGNDNNIFYRNENSGTFTDWIKLTGVYVDGEAMPLSRDGLLKVYTT